MIEVITDVDLAKFEAWSGATYTMEVLKKYFLVNEYEHTWDDLEDYIQECFTNLPNETDINDFLWFDKDQIAELFEFESWDNLEEYTDERWMSKRFK